MKTTLIIVTIGLITSALYSEYLFTENTALKQEVSMYSGKYRSKRLQEDVMACLKEDTFKTKYIRYSATSAGEIYFGRQWSDTVLIAAQAYKDSIIALKYK